MGVQGGGSPTAPNPPNIPVPGPPTTPNQDTPTQTQHGTNTNSDYPTDAGSTREISVIKYQFFEKEMGASVCMLETSAASWQSKISSLTQEVIRRLTNTSEDLREEKLDALNTYCTKLDKSGYANRQIVDTITSGVKGHAERRARLGKEHREGWETEEARDMKKLTGKLNRASTPTSSRRTRASTVTQGRGRQPTNNHTTEPTQVTKTDANHHQYYL